MTADARFDDELELTDYLRILRRRWVWITAVSATVMVLAVVVTLTQAPRYTATAQVSLGNSAAQEAIQGNLFVNVPSASRELSNEVNLALSDAVTSEVAAQLGFEPDVAVSADGEADAILFTATAAEGTDAARHANTWAQIYVDTKRSDAADSIDDAIEAFDTDLADLRAERQTLRQPLDELEDRLTTTTGDDERARLEAQVTRLRADLETELELIDVRVQAVAQSITNLELNRRLASTGTARVVQVAAPPQEAVNASLARNLVLATIVGLILGAAAALLAENLDRTIKATEDVSALGLPVLGGIPLPSRTIPDSELALATMRHTGTPMAEAYQKVRTAVEFALLGREINSLLITSPNQSEGKTTLSTNLAWAMSAVDHRVALVDVDFRRPRIHQVFNCHPEPGLSDNLLSGTPLTQLALRVDEAGSRNLIVIPTGTQPPSPADFVASPAFTSLIRNIEAEADLVVLDAPPVLPVSDALSIGRQVDAVILVVMAGQTTRDELLTTFENLRQVGADVIGVCVVGVKASPGSYDLYEPTAERRRRRRRGRSGGDRRVVDVRDPAPGALSLPS
ncbi:MAG: polysaccharide biosynthesis tyrosine autokinase [Acidimicrobiales bacterium]